jgi:uncharacterized protein (TIGR00251 family)
MPHATLNVRLYPRAKRNEIGGERDGVLRVSVAAPPVDGKANAALCKLIAKRAGVGRAAVTIARGERARDKVVRVDGMTEAELRGRLRMQFPSESVPTLAARTDKTRQRR